jgi:hypothetical protein
MQCPHCSIHFHDNWLRGHFSRNGQSLEWNYETARCSECKKLIIRIDHDDSPDEKLMIFPLASTRGPTPKEVPKTIAADYEEACRVLSISPKASAALSRRCLQNLLRANGYKAKDLSKEIDLLLDETDAKKAIPDSLRVTIDAIRNFGNFSAHPVTDLTTQQIIDVEDHEAEFCLEVLEEAFQHFYVRPAQALRRKAALDAKLSKAGKPPSK